MGSPIIRKTQDSWILREDSTRGEHALRWDTFLGGFSVSKHHRETLRRACQQVLQAIVDDIVLRRGVMSAGTCRAQYFDLRRLARWMVGHEIYRFCDLNSASISAYLKDRLITSGGRKPSFTRVVTHRRLIYKLWVLRDSYQYPLKDNPRHDAIFRTITTCFEPNGSYKALPDDHVVILIKASIDWLSDSVPRFRGLIERMWKLHQCVNGMKVSAKDDTISTFYAGIEQSPEYISLSSILDIGHLRPSDGIREGVLMTIGAALTLILYLTGMRISEVISLKQSCLEYRMHEDGFKYCYIVGQQPKLNSKEHRWIAPSPVEETIRLLLELVAPLRSRSRGQLFYSFVGPGPVPMMYTPILKMRPAVAQRLHKHFARYVFSRAGLEQPERIYPHQARKAFARFVALRDKSSLLALAQHFGHLHYAMTDRMYVGSDHELRHLLDTESHEDLAECLADLLTADAVGGKAADAVRVARSAYRFAGRAALLSQVERLIVDGVKLAPCDWGYCIYVSAFSACRGDENGPNEVRRSPDVCARCTNFSVTQRHRGWWENRCKRDELFLEEPGLTPQTKVFVEERLRRSMEVIHSLNQHMRGNRAEVPTQEGNDEK